jgi:SAM-dependent methyltransferase
MSQPRGSTALLLFAFSLFISSTLMFWIEPMFAKMILPMLGGTPSVWNMCIVFYQITLLAGYVYAYLITKWLEVRHQAICHFGLLLSVFIVLPIATPDSLTPHIAANPILWLFILLLASVGLPFFVISTTAPILQKWFTMTGHSLAKDPYFLYSASNLGSMVALFGYLFFLEPFLPLAVQSKAWGAGYTLLVVLISGCVMMVVRSSQTGREDSNFRPKHAMRAELPAAEKSREPTVGQRIRWVVLAFAPSSLLLGVTNYISIDIVQIPLLWIIPLAIYLITFILVFAQKAILSHRLMAWLQPFFLIPLMIPYYWGFNTNSILGIPLHLLLFFITSMVCHGELANSRPSTAHLTDFYVWLSIGGVLGGLFNTLIAPMIFNTLAEYPLVIALACLLRPPLNSDMHKPYERWLDLCMPLAFGIILVVPKLKIAQTFMSEDCNPSSVVFTIIILVSCFVGMFLYSFRNRPIRFGLGMGAIMLSSLLWTTGQGQVLYSERNFFGILKVLRNSGDYHFLYHGTTLHGAQSLNPARSHEPLTYFHRTGPLGQVFEVFFTKTEKRRVAIVGLGTGTIACYGRPGQHFTFFEIDPAVERIARDRRYFTFLNDCSANIDVVIGDARLSLARLTDPQYDLFILDAFSSDSIPVHLVTKEALKLYLSRLADGGILAFHISNRYLDLRPVLGKLAQDSNLTCLIREDTEFGVTERKMQKAASIWVVMSRRSSDLGGLISDHRWKPLQGRKGAKLWTDDFSNIPSVFMWSAIKIQIEQTKRLFHGNSL